MTNKIEKINWEKVTYWEKIDFGDSESIYFSRLDIWQLPMWIFHLLRKVATSFDRAANVTRKFIDKYTDSFDIQDHFKIKDFKGEIKLI